MDLKHVEVFLIDLDGTVYVGDKLLPGAKDAVDALRKAGRTICFLTNNSSRSKDEYLAKLARLGIGVSPKEIFTSQAATITYLHKYHKGKRVHLLGVKALESDLILNGIVVDESDPEVAVLGYDTELTYEKLCRFCLTLAKGVPYIATHGDLNCPSPRGMLPDAGSMMALIEKSTGRLPDVVVGKPNQTMLDALMDVFNVAAPQKYCMIGDRLTTDIAFGKRCGMVSVLVLSGETTAEMTTAATADIIVPGIGDIIGLL
ncbi:MAG: HAD-IIA family hydrolase [Clostridiales bacterium]|jgi:HAD superfamily hydrolase (TIGR01450 family)|nr:HAD-IIA family hydrolase [Clostridiales bacterium]